MRKEEDLTNWEKDVPLLASLKREDGFAVPENYFDNLSSEIMSQIKIKDLAGKKSDFQVPEIYFETLENKVNSAILLEENKDSLLDNHGGFIIPNNYFENNKAKIISKTRTEKSTFGKIISLKFIKYAAAACILLTASFGIYFNIQRTNNINYQLSKLPDDDIETYLKQNVEAADVPLIIENLENKPVFSLDENQLSADDLDAYLKTSL